MSHRIQTGSSDLFMWRLLNKSIFIFVRSVFPSSALFFGSSTGSRSCTNHPTW
ncbi:hypothetical protein L208DRAFT_801300 [Tricholoma matsutake]|nr:hypothetical protein L208DRAFT_801300 [Tricholoma matsutake 945]